MTHADALPLSPTGRRYGRFRDNPYHPARRLFAMTPPPALVLPPSSYDLVPYKGPTRNQGQEGSCTGQAGAEKIDLDYRQFADGWGSRVVGADEFIASAAFVYKSNLVADGDLGHDAGSSLQQTAITLVQKGACLNSVEPYNDHDYATPPTAEQSNNALLYKMGAYHFLPDLHAMKACLAGSAAGPGHSFIFGITVYSSFEGRWPEPGFMPIPDLSRDQVLGGHAQHAIGYDDTIKFPDGNLGGLLVQNSWGGKDVWPMGIDAPGHSDGGVYWLPYSFVSLVDPNYGPCVSDAWITHLGKPWS